MTLPIDPSRTALPPVAQFLAEAALQRQTALLGLDKPKPALPAAPSPLPTADPSAPPPSVTSPSPPGGPLPTPADQASISPQAREQLAAGFDPRRAGGADGRLQGARGEGAARASPPGASALPRGATPGTSGNVAASAASATSGTAWPASGLSAPLLRMVSALVAQVTAQAGVPQRVVAAQPWPIGMAQALESGALDADQPPLQTWLVRQGVVSTPEGPRGLALTLRAPVPWLAAQASPAAAGAAAAQVSASLGAGATAAGGALQVPLRAAARRCNRGSWPWCCRAWMLPRRAPARCWCWTCSPNWPPPCMAATCCSRPQGAWTLDPDGRAAGQRPGAARGRAGAQRGIGPVRDRGLPVCSAR